MELIRKFQNINKNDANLAGGKGASLGEMTQAGIPVPPGFVLLSNSFDQFLIKIRGCIDQRITLLSMETMNGEISLNPKRPLRF